MAKTHLSQSGKMVLKVLEYLHNLPEPPIGENMIQVKIADVAEELTLEFATYPKTISRETAKNILDSIVDSNMGLLVRTESNRGQDQYWYRRTFTLEQLSLLSTIITSSIFLNETEINTLLAQLKTLTSEDNAIELSGSDHFLRPRMMNSEALANLRIIHEAINTEKALRFYVGKIDEDMRLYYEKPIRGKVNKINRIILTENETIKQTHDKPFPDYGNPITCYPYALVWDNSRCYLICGVNKDDKIIIWNYRVDRMFELKTYAKAGFREPKGSKYYEIGNKRFNTERYLNSIFKMFPGYYTEVTLRFRKSLTRIIVEKFGYDVNIISENDEYAQAKVEVQVSRQFYGWLAGFYSDTLRIIEPAEEVNNYLNYLKRIVEYYFKEE